eukprot:6744985-Alexandrium_andersonii.AAC.1
MYSKGGRILGQPTGQAVDCGSAAAKAAGVVAPHRARTLAQKPSNKAEEMTAGRRASAIADTGG